MFVALFEPPERQMWQLRTDSSSCQQPSSHQEQVAKRKQREQMRPVLCQTAIPRFHMTELALDDPERMFDLRAHHGDDPVDLLVDRVELATLGRLSSRRTQPLIALGLTQAGFVSLSKT